MLPISEHHSACSYITNKIILCSGYIVSKSRQNDALTQAACCSEEVSPKLKNIVPYKSVKYFSLRQTHRDASYKALNISSQGRKKVT